MLASVGSPSLVRPENSGVFRYDELRVRHTVNYKDGDVEIIPLWKPTQMIKLLNSVKDFATEAAALEEVRAKDAQAAARRRNELQSVRL